MIIADKMIVKVARALNQANNIYTLEDIDRALSSGDMQSHVYRDTMAVTQVHQWPRRKAVNILFVIGNLGDAIVLHDKIEKWAKSIGADLMTAVGREGWWEHRLPGWKKQGSLYAKDIDHGRLSTGTNPASEQGRVTRMG
jgi:hypothetical protein